MDVERSTMHMKRRELCSNAWVLREKQRVDVVKTGGILNALLVLGEIG